MQEVRPGPSADRDLLAGADPDARRAGGERGHLMVALMVVLAVMAILMTVGGQAWVDFQHREDEAEMMFRARDIARAIVRFRQDQGAQPLTDLAQLLEPGSRRQYFLRRAYTDPLVKDGKWGLLYQGPDNSILDPNSSVMPTGLELGVADRPRERGSWQLGEDGSGPKEIGGLPIIGVKSLCKKKPFRVYKELSDYSLWQFTIHDVIREQAAPAKEGVPGKPTSSRDPTLGPGGNRGNRPNLPNAPNR